MQLVWLDLETTGLEPERDAILEIAVSIADLSSPFDARPAYHAVLGAHPIPYTGADPAMRIASGCGVTLDARVIEMHTKNGLLSECEASALRVGDVEDALLALVPEVADYGERPTLAGSSVHFDHAVLRSHMPELAARLSHRHYDVSAVKLFCRSLGMQKLPRAEAHRAQADVLESIEHARACAEWIARDADSVALRESEARGAAMSAERSTESLARRFHAAYERLAPSHGYQTRRETAVAWEDLPSANRALMIATCAAVLSIDPVTGESGTRVPPDAHGPKRGI